MLPALISLLALFFVFLITATRGLAQGNPPLPIELKVVGDNHPILNAGNYCESDGVHDSSPTPTDLTACYLAQPFTLSSGAFINRVSLTLVNSFFGLTG